MEFLNKYISGAVVPLSIVVLSLIFWIKLKGKPFTNMNFVFSAIFKDKNNDGGIKAVIFALAGTLGVGNIVGVASAISLGGAGAVFWMWISALLAMILKYCEVVLSILHRRNRHGENYGGAMYYMKDWFAQIKKSHIGIVFIFVFITFCLINGFTMGGIIQSNAITESLKTTLGIDNKISGVILSLLCIIVFLFNGKRIFTLCEKLVPFVSCLYLVISLAIILLSYNSIPSIFINIIKSAFSFESFGGGVCGFFLSKALRYGTIRGLFSNEAGCGTSPIAHATSNTDNPVKQGILGIVEVFIDTILVCSMTAFVILLNNDASEIIDVNPILIVYSSYSAVLGNIANIFLCISICLFAFATIICWGYYGKECIYYFSKRKHAETLYYCFYVFTIYLGSYIDLDFVWELADLAIGIMTVMNLFILYKMRNEIAQTTELYIKKSSQKRAQKIK